MKKTIYLLFTLLLILSSCKEDEIPYPGLLAIDNSNVFLEQKEGTENVNINTDIKDISVSVNEDGTEWCSAVCQDGILKISTKANNGPMRKTSLILNGDYRTLNVTVYQKGVSDNEWPNTKFTATCSDEQVSDGGGVKMIFNEDQTKYWHSAWSPIEVPLPHWIIVDMQEEKEVNKIRLGWRKYNDSYFASTKKTEILASLDGKDYSSLGFIVKEAPEGLRSPNYPAYNDLSFTKVKARYIKLFMHESNATNGTCNLAYFKAYMP